MRSGCIVLLLILAIFAAGFVTLMIVDIPPPTSVIERDVPASQILR